MNDETLIKIHDWFIKEVQKAVKRGETSVEEGANLIVKVSNSRSRTVEMAGLSKANEDDLPDVSPTGYPRGFMRSGAYTN